MKRIIIMILSLIMIFAFTANIYVCADRNTGDVNYDGEVNNKDVTALFRTVSGCYESPFDAVQASGDELVKPDKTAFEPEKQALADEYYLKMKEQYPEFGQIPRDLLFEHVFIDDEGYFSVEFEFCYGGARTDCSCRFSSPNQTYPEGRWTLHENGFKKFYKTGITMHEMKAIREDLTNQVINYINEYKLANSGVTPDNIMIFLQDYDGKLSICTEWIASVTDQTTKEFGCGDHAHVFGEYVIE